MLFHNQDSCSSEIIHFIHIMELRDSMSVLDLENRNT
jgi:hypothetical protein